MYVYSTELTIIQHGIGDTSRVQLSEWGTYVCGSLCRTTKPHTYVHILCKLNTNTYKSVKYGDTKIELIVNKIIQNRCVSVINIDDANHPVGKNVECERIGECVGKNMLAYQREILYKSVICGGVVKF